MRNIFGNGIALGWTEEINYFANAIYYCLTTAGSLQTLGEEYTNLIQVDVVYIISEFLTVNSRFSAKILEHSTFHFVHPTTKGLPYATVFYFVILVIHYFVFQVYSTKSKVASFKQRVSMIALHTFFPLCLDKFFNYLERELMSNQLKFLSNQDQVYLLQALPKMRTMLITFHRLHLSVFYMKEIYYTLAKRIADVTYVKYVVSPENKTNSFAILGKFSFAQALLMLCLQLYDLYKVLIAVKNNTKYSATQHVVAQCSNPIENESQKCSLCLEIRHFTSLTTCGHLFCWACIQKWIRSKAECPLCRETLQPNKIVCLKNYN